MYRKSGPLEALASQPPPRSEMRMPWALFGKGTTYWLQPRGSVSAVVFSGGKASA